MFNYKATSYEKLEKPKQDNKFKKNAYEEIRKLVENNEGNDLVNDVKKKTKNNKQENIKFSFKLFD